MPDAPIPKILIVDDEQEQMNALCETLQEHGFATTGFSDPIAALDAERQTPFDLMLCDLMMPRMNGLQLLNAALQLDPNLVGIIMTGQGTIGTAVEAMKAGALDYILKPFTLSMALPVLSRGLSVRRLRLENAVLQRNLKERNESLQATNHELDAFAGSVAHDLHAPVRHIRAYGQMLMEESGNQLTGNSSQYLSHMMEAAQRLSQLIEDLLKFSRTAHLQLQREEVDLNRVAATARANLEPETRDRKIQWKTADLPAVRGDAALLHQVYFNLLSNALKYTAQKSVAEIEIGWKPDGPERQVFFVKDNGVGFDMAFGEKLFKAFQRLHPETEFHGSGIGLANVRRIVSRHGGTTWAEGEVNKGACFYFTLPT